jgi:signal transduction histidine kinase
MNTRLVLRMAAPAVAVSLLLLAVGVGTAWQVQRWQKNLSAELRANVSGVRAAEELEIAVRETRARLDRFLITGEKKYLEGAPALRADAGHWLAQAERWSLTPQERDLMTRARKGYQRFLAELDRITNSAPAGALPQEIRRLIDEVLVQEVLHPTHEYLDFNEDEVETSISRNEAFTDRLVYSLLLLGTCGSAAGLLAGFGVARGFSRSLVQLSVPVRAAAGQLDEVVGPITFDPGGDLKELEGVLHLIADRIGTVVGRLRQSEREALRAEQLAALGQMAAGMAHELRNPLTSMKMLVQGALAGEGWGNEGLPGPGAEPGLGGRDLAVLEEEITRLERLIQSFLDFARPPQLEKRVLDVRPLVGQTLGLVAGRASAGGTRVEFVPPPQPVTAAVDPGQFRQVLLNLLLNALSATGSGGSITINLANDPDGWLTLRVADTGCGLPGALGGRIFDPFTSTKPTGLGLGLSICRRIADAHGGSITAANRPEGGAVFTVRFPSNGTFSREPGASALPRSPQARG